MNCWSWGVGTWEFRVPQSLLLCMFETFHNKLFFTLCFGHGKFETSITYLSGKVEQKVEYTSLALIRAGVILTNSCYLKQWDYKLSLRETRE